jgi:hypothetical protein
MGCEILPCLAGRYSRLQIGPVDADQDSPAPSRGEAAS